MVKSDVEWKGKNKNWNFVFIPELFCMQNFQEWQKTVRYKREKGGTEMFVWLQFIIVC